MDNEIIGIVADTFGVKSEELSPQTALESIVSDSLDLFELIAVLDAQYEMRIEPASMAGVATIGDLARYVEANRGTAGTESTLKTF